MKAFDFNITEEKGGAFLLTGKEDPSTKKQVFDIYLKDLVINAFKSLVPEEHRFFNLKYIEELTDPNVLKEAISTFSMFDSPIVIFVEDDKFKDSADTTKEYIKAISTIEDGVYVIFSGYNSISTALKKALKEIECKIDFKPANLNEIKKICLHMAKDLTLSTKALDTIIEYCNGDLGRISMEIEKLRSYKLGKPIELDDVDLLVENTMDNQIYELSNAISNNEFIKARKMLDRFIEKGVRYSVILGSLTGFYRRMLHASLSNLSDIELAEVFGVREYSITVARRLAKRYTQMQLMNIVKDLVDAEYLNRSGIIEESTAFNNVISKLMTKN
ncbi:MAG TPA: hypothetical protein PKX91_03495 [Clostridia bacterium]|jgi:DNA polymerase III delta subunit|nr:hypothetical protein [Clostridia bacterium]